MYIGIKTTLDDEYMDVSTQVISESVDITEKLHNGLKPSCNSIRFKVKAGAGLYRLLIEQEVVYCIIMVDDTVLLRGKLRPIFSGTAIQHTSQMSVEAVDFQYLLKNNVPREILLTDKPIYDPVDLTNSILYELFTPLRNVGITQFTGDSIADTIPVFYMKKDDTYESVLQKLCYEYGFVYTVRNATVAIHRLAYTNDPMPTFTFSPANTNSMPKIEKKEYAKEQVSIEWDTVTAVQNDPVWQDATGSNGYYDSYIQVMPNGVYPESSDTKKVWANFGSSQGELLCVQNPSIDYKMDTGLKLDSVEFEANKCAFRIKNSIGQIQVITRMRIIGTSVVKKDKNYSKFPATTSETIEKYTASYIQRETDAAALCRHLFTWAKNSRVIVTLLSSANRAIGETVLYVEKDSGVSIVCRITDKRYTAVSRSFTYKLEAVSAVVLGDVDADLSIGEVSPENPSLKDIVDIVDSSGGIIQDELDKKIDKVKNGDIAIGAIRIESLSRPVIEKIDILSSMNIGQSDLMDEIIAMIDDALISAQSSIIQTDTALSIKVADSEKRSIAKIEIQADAISAAIAQITNLEETTASQLKLQSDSITAAVQKITSLEEVTVKTTAMLSIADSRIDALVSGGGASGSLSLSLSLPPVISKVTRSQFVQASSESLVAAVYIAFITDDNPNPEYMIKTDVTKSNAQALWQKLRTAGLLGSTFSADVDNILLNGKVYINNVIDATGGTIIDGEHIRTDLLDTAKIILKNEGLIQSSNFKTGTSGFCIKANGETEFQEGIFKNILITGDSVFGGDIMSGPLVLNNSNPSNITDIWKYKKGDLTDDLFYKISNAGNLGKIVSCNGTVISSNMYTVHFSYYRVVNLYNGCEMVCYDKDVKKITNLVWWRYNNVVGYDQYFEGIVLKESGFGKFVTLSCDLQIGYYNPAGRTFKLRDIPTNEPNEIGAVWADSGGYLRIKR